MNRNPLTINKTKKLNEMNMPIRMTRKKFAGKYALLHLADEIDNLVSLHKEILRQIDAHMADNTIDMQIFQLKKLAININDDIETLYADLFERPGIERIQSILEQISAFDNLDDAIVQLGIMRNDFTFMERWANRTLNIVSEGMDEGIMDLFKRDPLKGKDPVDLMTGVKQAKDKSNVNFYSNLIREKSAEGKRSEYETGNTKDRFQSDSLHYNVSKDRKIMESLISKYGKKDILNYVSRIGRN